MELVSKLILESPAKVITIDLKQPMSISEIWQHCVCLGRKPDIITLSKGVVRVTFGYVKPIRLIQKWHQFEETP